MLCSPGKHDTLYSSVPKSTGAGATPPPFDASVSEWTIEARWLTFVWLFVGLVVLFSASHPVGETNLGRLYYVKRQLAWIMLGLIDLT